MWISQHFNMPTFDFADFDTAQRAGAPAHFGVSWAIIRLTRAPKQQHRRAKTGRLPVFSGPNGTFPTRPADLFARCDPPRDRSAQGRELLVKGAGAPFPKSLDVTVEGPQRFNEGILHHPGIENGEQGYLFTFGFQLANHLLCD